jgi:hypothetical protein
MTPPDANTVVALAGRRIDAAGAPDPRFPAENVGRVRQELEALFQKEKATHLVSSAACGADIVALEVAAHLGLEARIILPFDAARFRETSVVDRGTEWGPRYDAVIARARQVTVVDPVDGDHDAAYAAVTLRIIEQTRDLAGARSSKALAVAVWDDKPRSDTDATKDFLDKAVGAGLAVRVVRTL